MDQVAQAAIEGSHPPVNDSTSFGAFSLALAIALLIAIAMRSFSGRRNRGAFEPTADAGSQLSHSSVSEATSPASVKGSDYYVPTADELAGGIKEHILDRQKRDSLQLARELIGEYRRRLESGELKNVYCVIANPLLDDYPVMRLCEEVLKYRGWSIRNHCNGAASISPLNSSSSSCSFTPIDLNPIAESDSFAELIERNIIAPRKALALRIAKELVDGYRLKLEADKPTSLGITVTLAEQIDYNVFTEVENILAPRGWSVTRYDSSSYGVWPAEKRNQPYRGGRYAPI